MTKLIIKTEIKKTEIVEHDVEITLPHFCKIDDTIYCIVSDKLAYEVRFDMNRPDRYSYHDETRGGDEIRQLVATGTPITKAEFETVYNLYLESVNRFYHNYLNSCNAILEESIEQNAKSL